AGEQPRQVQADPARSAGDQGRLCHARPPRVYLTSRKAGGLRGAPRTRMSAMVMVLAVLMSAQLADAGSDCGRADLVPASQPAKEWLDEKALLAAACDENCVATCREGGADRGKRHVLAHYQGSFVCPGALESIVGLFPCDDAPALHGIAGSIVLLRAVRPAA